MNHALRRFFILFTVFCITFLGVFTVRKLQNSNTLLNLLKGKPPVEDNGQFTLLDKAPLDLSDMQVMAAINTESARLVKAVVPSVVSIDTAGIRHERVRDVWGRTWLQPRNIQGQGSGVIVTREGHILTNHHVIQGTPHIRLTMHDGTVHSAKVIGSDPAVDIALLKIEAEGPFSPLKIGDSNTAEVGHTVFAIGSPFGLGESVTDGKISAKKRTFSDSHVDLLQTSAAINPGNSGGPLVNITGEIIGINSRIYSTDKKNPGFQGISFAIPSNAALKTMKDILSRGRPIRGFLGMAFEELDPHTRAKSGYQGAGGIRIIGLVTDSPATRAGIKKNDIILSYESVNIKSIRHLIKLIQQSEVNSSVEIQIWRDNSKHKITATIGEAGNFNQRILRDEEKKATLRLDPEAALKTIGLTVRKLNPSEISENYQGVIIERISTNSNLRGKVIVGDNITTINGSAINNISEFNTRLAASVTAQQITELEIRRGSQAIRVVISGLKP